MVLQVQERLVLVLAVQVEEERGEIVEVRPGDGRGLDEKRSAAAWTSACAGG